VEAHNFLDRGRVCFPAASELRFKMPRTAISEAMYRQPGLSLVVQMEAREKTDVE
jgi:hypothetical protein